jgi:hypothetical protein
MPLKQIRFLFGFVARNSVTPAQSYLPLPNLVMIGLGGPSNQKSRGVFKKVSPTGKDETI